MDSDAYTVHVSPDVAGIALRVASTSDAELATHVPSMAIYEGYDKLIAFSDKKAKVVMTAIVHPSEYSGSRVLVGVRDKKRKIVTLYPAAGDQVTMLHPRLNAVQYKGVQSDKFPGQAPSERADRYKKKSQLVQAFGSTRRVRKLSQGAVTQMLDGNVLSRADIEDAVEELGKQAEGSGLTTKQVMTQVSAARAIPPHNLEATTAQEAYKTDEVISENDLHYLDTDTLQQALQNSRKIQSLKTSGAWVQLNSLVRLVIRMKAGPGLLESEAEDCSKWLALLQACCSVFKQRDHTEFDESSDDLIQAEGDDEKGTEEADLFADKKRRRVSMGAFARDNAFISVLAAKHWLSKFGEVTSLAGMTVYKISESQKVLLNTTIALCAIRCYGNKVTADMVTSLLRVVKPRTAQEVSTWFKQIGCNTTAVKKAGDAQTFTASLLNTRTDKALAACLPDLNRRRSRR